MTLPARRLNITRRQGRLLPCQRTAVGFLDGGCRALPAVTHYAAVLIKGVRDDRMPPKRLCADVSQAGFFQSEVAGGAAIDDSELRKPDLLDALLPAKMALQGYRVSTAADQRQILLLVATPFTEIILGRRNGQRKLQQQADYATSSHRTAEQCLPQCLPQGRQRALL